MRKNRTLVALPVLLMFAAAPNLLAQRWELGAGAGGSFYTKQTVSSNAGSVESQFKPGFGATAFLGQNGNRLGGEIRYSFMRNEMELTGLGRSFKMSGRSQAIHYDVLVFFSDGQSKVRPYVSVGGGIKQYSGTGADVAIQPLGTIAVLTRTSEWKPMISAGAGVKFIAGNNWVFRAELRSYITQTPKEVVTPVNGKISGWTYQLMPVFTISYLF